MKQKWLGGMLFAVVMALFLLPTPALAMQVFVDLTIEGADNRLTLEVEAADTITMVKKKIQEEQGIPPERQKLFFGKQELTDERALQDYSIGKEAALLLLCVSEDGYVELSDEAGLAAIAYDLKGSYRLTADITLTKAWTPVTEAASIPYAVFSGNLDGNGHVIRNLFMDSGEQFASLIGDMAGGSVRGLGVELAAQGMSGAGDSGGLVSFMDGGLIENCFVSGAVTNTQPEDCSAGGLVAYLSSGRIASCYTTGSVTGGCAGGLVGTMEDGEIENCYSLAVVRGEYEAGGLIGSVDEGDISCSYAAGEASSESALVPGLLVGTRNGSCQITASYYEIRHAWNGIGSDDAPSCAAPTGVTGSRLKSGVPLTLAGSLGPWDQSIWWFQAGAYPRLRKAADQAAGEQLATPAVQGYSPVKLSEDAPISYMLKVAAVENAVGYAVQLYQKDSGTPVGLPFLWTSPKAARSGEASYLIPLNQALDAAAKEETAADPEQTVFSYRAAVAALGSGGGFQDSVPSGLYELPVFQRLTAVVPLDPIVCRRGDALTKQETMTGTVDGSEQQLKIRWYEPLVPMPVTADFTGKDTFKAPLLLPEGVLNPDGWTAIQVVESYSSFEAPTGLAWDSSVPGKAVWSLPSDPGGAVFVQLLDKNRNPVGEEKVIPRGAEQWYDFTGMIHASGSGDYYFRVKTKGAGYLDESAWVTVPAACRYTNPSAGSGSSPEPGGKPEWNPFEDVAENDWFHDSVKYVYENGLMIGASDHLFRPYFDTSRGMIVTILWRLEQEPEGAEAQPFADVKAGSYCEPAVAWAAEQGIVQGYTETEFGPEDPIARQELAAILYRYAGSPETSGTLEGFTDGDGAIGYARDALRWAVEQGILTGKGSGILDPTGKATRAEAAAMLERFLR